MAGASRPPTRSLMCTAPARRGVPPAGIAPPASLPRRPEPPSTTLLRPPSRTPAQAGELDADFDGRPDAIHFTLRLAPSAAAVHSVKLLLQFSYALEGAAPLKIAGLAYVTAASPLPGAALHVDGQVCLCVWGGGGGAGVGKGRRRAGGGRTCESFICAAAAGKVCSPNRRRLAEQQDGEPFDAQRPPALARPQSLRTHHSRPCQHHSLPAPHTQPCS